MGSSFLEGPAVSPVACPSPLWVSSILASVLMLREKVLMLQLILGLTKVHLHLREQKISPQTPQRGLSPFPINWRPPASTRLHAEDCGKRLEHLWVRPGHTHPDPGVRVSPCLLQVCPASLNSAARPQRETAATPCWWPAW